MSHSHRWFSQGVPHIVATHEGILTRNRKHWRRSAAANPAASAAQLLAVSDCWKENYSHLYTFFLFISDTSKVNLHVVCVLKQTMSLLGRKSIKNLSFLSLLRKCLSLVVNSRFSAAFLLCTRFEASFLAQENHSFGDVLEEKENFES